MSRVGLVSQGEMQAHAEEMLREAVELWLECYNRGALRVLEKCGFKRIGRSLGFGKARAKTMGKLFLKLPLTPGLQLA